MRRSDRRLLFIVFLVAFFLSRQAGAVSAAVFLVSAPLDVSRGGNLAATAPTVGIPLATGQTVTPGDATATSPAVRCGDYMKAGRLSAAGKRWAEAVAAYSAFLNDAECRCREYALFYLAEALEHLGQTEKARETLEELLRRHPRFPRVALARIRLADILMDGGKWRQALDLMKKNPENADTLIRKARCQRALGHPRKAAAILETLWIEYPASNNASEVDAMFRELSAELHIPLPPKAPAKRYRRAKNLDGEGRRAEALAIFEQLLESPIPKDMAANCKLFIGKILTDTGKTSRALNVYTDFLKRYPGHPSTATVLFRMGTLYRRLKDDAAYLATTRRLETFKSSKWWALSLLRRGGYWLSEKRYRKALSDFDKVLKRNGKLRDTARWKRAWIYYDQGKLDAAAREFRWFITHRKNTGWEPQAIYWVARIRASGGDGETAQRLYRDILTRFPLTYSGRRAAERLNMQPVLSREPLDEEPPRRTSTYGCAQMLARAGYHADAAELFRRLARKGGDGFVLLEARCRYRHGDVFKARNRILNYFHRRIVAGWLPDEIRNIILPKPRDIWPIIEENARRYQVAPELVAALILQESGFSPDAFSQNLAAGYMQLIPSLFKRMAASWSPPVDVAQRRVPRYNIRAGVQYLRFLLDRYHQHLPKALAAYNAGEHRVDDWQQRFSGMADDEWVEHIPFSQTRLFVKHILRNVFMYRLAWKD